MSYILESVSPDDFDEVFALRKAAYLELVEREWGWDEEEQRARFLTRFTAEETLYVVVEDRRVGELWVRRDEREIFIASIALHPDVRRQGVGTAVVRGLQQEARERGVPLRLRVIHANFEARRLYDRLGFREERRNEERAFMVWRA